MNRRPRILSFPAAVVTFFKLLKLPSAANQFPAHTPQTVPVTPRTYMLETEVEVGYSDLSNNGCSKATEDEEPSLGVDATS